MRHEGELLEDLIGVLIGVFSYTNKLVLAKLIGDNIDALIGH